VLSEHKIPTIGTESQIFQYSQVSGHKGRGREDEQQVYDCSFHDDYLVSLIDINSDLYEFFYSYTELPHLSPRPICLLARIAVRGILCLMTLSIRRTLLAILLVPAFAGTAASALAWTAWFQNQYALGYEIPQLTASWWSSWRIADISDLTWAMAGLSFLSFFPLLSELILRKRFSRSPSPEVFFLRLFLLTLPFQASRLLIPLISTGLLTISWGLAITRISWFARFTGISALLSISIFSGDMPFRRSGSILGMGVLAAMGISVMMPLDVTQPLGNLLVRSGTDTSLALATVSVEILAVLALAGNAMIRRDGRFYFLAGYLLLVVAGADLSFFSSRPLIIPGAVLMVVGVVGFSGAVRRIYQWI
jgi:hypothetical protein